MVRSERTAERDDDTFDLLALPCPVSVLQSGDDSEQAVIGDRQRRIRLDFYGDSVMDGPVRLHYDVEGFARADAALRTLRRFLALQKLGRFPESLFPRDRVAERRLLALRAYDGVMAGASQREIARVLLGERLVDGNAENFDSIRKRVARLVDLAEARMEIGYRRFFLDSAATRAA